MDPSLQAALLAYFNSDPAFAAEYNRHIAQSRGTDNRTPEEWLFDGLQSNPAQLELFKGFNANAAGSQAMPAEQALGETVLNDYVLAGIEGDKERQQEAAAILSRINSGIDQAIAINGEAIDGRRLAAEYGMADETGNRLRQSALDEGAALRTALGTMDAERRAALEPLLAERLAAGETAHAAVM